MNEYEKSKILSEIWRMLRDNGLNGITFDREVRLDDGLTLNGFHSDGSYTNTSTNEERQIESLEFSDLIALQEEVELQIDRDSKAMSRCGGMWY